MEAIILAGGQGTRLQSKVKDVPKPMAPIPVRGRERPFLELLLSYWIRQGVKHFVLSTGHLAEKVSKHFGDSFEGAALSYARETEPLGTGGGAFLALKQLKSHGPAILLNGDSFVEVSAADLLGFHNEKRSRFTLTLTEVEANTRYSGIEVRADGKCASILPVGSGGKSWVNAGVYAFDPESFSRSTAPGNISLERDLLPGWIGSAEGVFGFKSTGRFIDIGTPEDYARAGRFFESIVS